MYSNHVSTYSVKPRKLNLGKVEAAVVFKPGAWIALSYIAYFVIPSLVAILISRTILGYGDIDLYGLQQDVLNTLVVITFFIGLTLVTLYVTRRLLPAKQRSLQFLPPNQKEVLVAWVSFVLGLFCAYLLGQAFSGDTRSGLVSTAYGQLIFAGSYGAILGYLALALHMLNRGKILWFCVLTLIFVGVLVVLGGRGRVVWPLLSLFATWKITQHGTMHLGKLIGLGVVVFISASMIDPLLSYYYGFGTDALLRVSTPGSLLENVFVAKRNFDGFHNFFLIYNIDPFPQSFSYMLNGPRTAFMSEFFPEVLAKGVGFPATVPGTFWMVGGWAGLIFGAVAFGSLAGVMTTRFNRTRSQLSICFQIYLFTWLFNVGLSLFDNVPKIIVVLALMAPFYAARRFKI